MANAIKYAEDELGVHTILEGAMKAREDLDKVYTILSENRDAKRLAERQLEDREMELAIAERGRHPEMSQAQMDKHLKMAIHQDKVASDLRGQLAEIADALDGAEFDRKLQEKTIEIGCARMTELGGYFQYLAAVKSASTASVK